MTFRHTHATSQHYRLLMSYLQPPSADIVCKCNFYAKRGWVRAQPCHDDTDAEFQGVHQMALGFPELDAHNFPLSIQSLVFIMFMFALN